MAIGISRSIAPYALDKASLLGVVASALRCRSVRTKRRTTIGYSYGMHLFGCASDLERTELLYTSLLVQASYGLAATVVPSLRAGGGVPSVLDRRLHPRGRRPAAGGRTAGRSGADAGDGPSMALVLADRSGRVDRRVAEVYPRLGTAPPRRLAGSGQGHGYAAGQRADLGGARLGRATSGSLGAH